MLTWLVVELFLTPLFQTFVYMCVLVFFERILRKCVQSALLWINLEAGFAVALFPTDFLLSGLHCFGSFNGGFESWLD
jgi:hypothetical protein